MPPQAGIFTAIIAGFLISLLGGSRVQIGGPTGAFIVIVYGIVQDHFGHIAVDSSPGQGTTIRLHLPIRHAQPQQKRA